MYPILFRLGPVTLYTYGAMLVVAFLASTGLAARAARRLPPGQAPLSPQQVWDIASLALLGGIVGGRLFYVLLYWESFVQSLADVVAIWQGGLVWYGGFLGGVLASWAYARAKRLPILRTLDHLIPFVALGHAIGRVGCFLNGCCYGRGGLPVQLLEAAGLILLSIALRRLATRTAILQRPGRLLGVYLIAYAALRFILEGFRGDQTVWWAGLTLQQLISVAMLLLGLWLVQNRAISDT